MLRRKKADCGCERYAHRATAWQVATTMPTEISRIVSAELRDLINADLRSLGTPVVFPPCTWHPDV